MTFRWAVLWLLGLTAAYVFWSKWVVLIPVAYLWWKLWRWRTGRTELGYGERGAIREDIKDALYEKYGGRCAHCAMTDYLHMHHLHPRHQGGDNRLSNLVLVCPNHHAEAHARLTKRAE